MPAAIACLMCVGFASLAMISIRRVPGGGCEAFPRPVMACACSPFTAADWPARGRCLDREIGLPRRHALCCAGLARCCDRAALRADLLACHAPANVNNDWATRMGTGMKNVVVRHIDRADAAVIKRLGAGTPTPRAMPLLG